MKTISLADTSFTSATLAAFVESVTWETAAPVKVVLLDGNTIGHAISVSMQPGANTGVPIKSGTFVCFDGRVAEVHQDPDESDSGNLKKLTWVDTGEDAWNQGNYIKASEV